MTQRGDSKLRDELDVRRARIDALDARIVELLNERQSEALAIRSIKEEMGFPRLDSAREESLVARLTEINDGPLDDQDVRDIYAVILSVSKR